MMFYFYIPEGICFAAFVALSCTWLHYARFHLCFSVVCVFCLLTFSCCQEEEEQEKASRQNTHTRIRKLTKKHV
jgi:hypothetical protein